VFICQRCPSSQSGSILCIPAVDK